MKMEIATISVVEYLFLHHLSSLCVSFCCSVFIHVRYGCCICPLGHLTSIFGLVFMLFWSFGVCFKFFEFVFFCLLGSFKLFVWDGLMCCSSCK